MDNYSLSGTSALDSGIHNRSGTGTLWAKESLSNQKSIPNVSYSTTDQTTFYTEPPMGNGTVYYYEEMENYPEGEKLTLRYEYIFYIFIAVIAIFGMLGNGMVIWLLGCRIKKNHFTTYVLNLAVADLFLLTILGLYGISYFFPQISTEIFLYLYPFLLISAFSTSQLLLTVISVDRCVSVFFPLWHHCHRPKHLSAILSASIWVISFLPTAIWAILNVTESWHYYSLLYYQFIANGFLCLPVMIISSLMLFIKVYCKSKQRRRRKLVITILITVLFFCLFCFPFNAYIMILYLFQTFKREFWEYSLFSSSLNSSVNPLIYYLVGRLKKGRSNKSMKAALQELFKEAEIKSPLQENPPATPV